MKRLALYLWILSAVLPAVSVAADYPVSVDECDKPFSWYYDNTGGDRGILNASDMEYTWDGTSSCKVTALGTGGQLGGMWYSLIGTNQDNLSLDLKAIFGPYVKSEWQGEISEVDVLVNDVYSPTNNQNLELRVELKDVNNSPVCSETWGNLVAESLPKQFVWILPESCKQAVEVVVWVMDKAEAGDSVSVDWLRMKSRTPDMQTRDQAFLWTFGSLMSSYDPVTDLIQDRSNYLRGDSENISATAKTAKVVYYAYKKGYVTLSDATEIITGIAGRLLNTVPRGPGGTNTLWPHFTRNGGTEIAPSTEWASGDTVYAALDIMTALQMLGDPQNQLPDLEAFLRNIDWPALISAENYILHGYDHDGILIPFAWTGFGMETAGVDLAYAAATGNVAGMTAPPTDNGAGFIENANYPLVLSGTDAWGNDWDTYRSDAADDQIGWYCTQEHENIYLCGAGLFGLSAAENPEADAYVAYGTGGKSVPEDGGDEVVVLHYSGMIADMRLPEAIHVWEVLRDGTADFLQDRITISPLNNMESMRIDKITGDVTVNHLKGSWNLALQDEGWAMSDTAVKYDLVAAVMNNAFLKSGFDLLSPSPVLPVKIDGTTPSYYLTIQSAYDDAINGDIVKMWAADFPEAAVLDRDVSVTLSGGFDSAFADKSGGMTSCDSLAISSGEVTVDELVIR